MGKPLSVSLKIKAVTFADLPVTYFPSKKFIVCSYSTFETHTYFWYGVRVYTFKSILEILYSKMCSFCFDTSFEKCAFLCNHQPQSRCRTLLLCPKVPSFSSPPPTPTPCPRQLVIDLFRLLCTWKAVVILQGGSIALSATWIIEVGNTFGP